LKLFGNQLNNSKMASTILYKFRSGTTFEALPLPGSAARLFDVKKAIVKAKKLDGGSMEFDLSVRNADTNEEYANEGMILPRGTRLIVQRLPAARGHGFLARMARNEYAGATAPIPGHGQPQQVVSGSGAPNGFYTIDSRARDDHDDEFVQSGGAGVVDEEKELAALQAVTNLRCDGPAMTGGGFGGVGGRGGGPAGRGGGPAGQGGPGRGGPGGRGGNFTPNFRPNADPELREQEKKLMPKKRATGIPRTFLNLSAPPQTDGNKEGDENESSVPLLQPNTLGFKELVSRGGGQSENSAGTRRDLDYALKLTAMTIPEFLQCGICHSVVKNAMLMPWDPEGRTACETCIRDSLTQNGFRCPLTGMDGVSPDDLHANVGLRKAADLFIKGVMEKIDEIEKQMVVEAAASAAQEADESAGGNNTLEGVGADKGVIVSKRTAIASHKKEEDDPFGGGDDDFGGDVFAVEIEKPEEEELGGEESAKPEVKPESVKVEETGGVPEQKEAVNNNQDKIASNEESKIKADQNVNRNDRDLHVATRSRTDDRGRSETPSSDKQHDTPTQQRRERRRGPPVGYAMGPAGGAVGVPQRRNEDSPPSNDGGHQGGGRGGRGRGSTSPVGGGRGGGHFQDRGSYRGRGGRGRGRFSGHGEFEGGRGSYNQNGNDDVSSKPYCVSVVLRLVVCCLDRYYNRMLRQNNLSWYEQPKRLRSNSPRDRGYVDIH
jgi:hypothetical protein